MPRRGNGSNSATVYVDGACSKNGYDGSKAGVGVYWGEGHPNNLSQPLSGRQTNNRAEIQAGYEAIKQAERQNLDKITICTDSDLLYKSATNWMPKWKSNNWRGYGGRELKNVDDYKQLDHAIQSSGVDVEWRKVKAHSGVHGNEVADRLANDAIRRN